MVLPRIALFAALLALTGCAPPSFKDAAAIPATVPIAATLSFSDWTWSDVHTVDAEYSLSPADARRIQAQGPAAFGGDHKPRNQAVDTNWNGWTTVTRAVNGRGAENINGPQTIALMTEEHCNPHFSPDIPDASLFCAALARPDTIVTWGGRMREFALVDAPDARVFLVYQRD